MRKLSVATALVSAVVLMASAALASPPSGQFSFQDHGRGQTAGPATFTMPTGADTLLASYTLSPGGDSGWRATPAHRSARASPARNRGPRCNGAPWADGPCADTYRRGRRVLVPGADGQRSRTATGSTRGPARPGPRLAMARFETST